MRIVLVTEKPFDASRVLPRVLEAYPEAGQDGAVAILLGAVLLPTRFAYPAGLRWTDYPVTPEPAYRPIAFDDPGMPAHAAWRGWRRHVPVDDHDSGCRPGPVRLDRTGLLAFAAGCDLVVDAMGRDPAERHALSRFLRDYPVDNRRTRVVHVDLGSPARADIARGLRAGGPWDGTHAAEGADRLKRRFDYGFAVNAQAVLRRTLDAAGIGQAVPVPSKFQVQALYALRGLGTVAHGGLADTMAKWRGTGRYERRPGGRHRAVGFGSPTSRLPIVDYLARTGLAVRHGGMLSVGDAGHGLLDALHPDCEDPDLPFRLDEWCRMPEADGAARIDRYLRTWFGRQKRFLGRSPACAG